MMMTSDLPLSAKIISRHQDAKDVFTIKLEWVGLNANNDYRYIPGQFNMLYLLGAGQVAISIANRPHDKNCYTHTIRQVGRITNGLSQLKPQSHLGLRGPFGKGWPIDKAIGKDILIITGGLGCAPSVSLIHHIISQRSCFGRLSILQGVKHSADLIYKKEYESWAKQPDTTVLLAADVSGANWQGYKGYVTELLDKVKIHSDMICFLCGPEQMMLAAIKYLVGLQFPPQGIFLSMERSMGCGVGTCGHCQLGSFFVCKDGPVFCYDDIKHWLGVKGF